MFELAKLEQPLRKLRRLLNGFPADPRPEEVHTLRTHARRLEAVVAALLMQSNKAPRRLLKVVTPVRKAAGRVRDMDVLLGDALKLDDRSRSEALVELVEHLGRMRIRQAKKLRKALVENRKEARHLLKRSSKLIRKRVTEESPDRLDHETAPQILITELAHWPVLNADNLHSFRIQVKELRYMLQLAGGSDRNLIRRLGRVKDAIGEWHDWIELLKIARKILDEKEDAAVLDQIQSIGKAKLQLALSTANAVRSEYFDPVREGKARKVLLRRAAGF